MWKSSLSWLLYINIYTDWEEKEIDIFKVEQDFVLTLHGLLGMYYSFKVQKITMKS